MVQDRKFYLTKEGLEKLRREFEGLKQKKAQKMERETPMIAAPHGVDSEYLTFQEDISFLESRLEELEEILRNYELIKPPPKNRQNVVQIGATVQVEVEGQIDEFTIVGPLEANPFLGKISHESPVGKALLNHKVGDEVKVQSTVTTIYKIKKITYHNI
ncbi:MAG: GreA/GreB family elongation factor [Candidatus Pacebacteria bacterium]|nr:GreA/GreB family elongation factor [Candidatus Paceibacterota bacterium]